jgi:hypothetical protein
MGKGTGKCKRGAGAVTTEEVVAGGVVDEDGTCVKAGLEGIGGRVAPGRGGVDLGAGGEGGWSVRDGGEGGSERGGSVVSTEDLRV